MGLSGVGISSITNGGIFVDMDVVTAASGIEDLVFGYSHRRSTLAILGFHLQDEAWLNICLADVESSGRNFAGDEVGRQSLGMRF